MEHSPKPVVGQTLIPNRSDRQEHNTHLGHHNPAWFEELPVEGDTQPTIELFDHSGFYPQTLYAVNNPSTPDKKHQIIRSVIGGFIGGFVALVVLFFLQVGPQLSPYVKIVPGPVTNLKQAVTINNALASYETENPILFTTIQIEPLTWQAWLGTKLPWATSVETQRTVGLGDSSDTQINAHIQMVESKTIAVQTTLQHLGIPAPEGYGVIVGSTKPQSPAEHAGLKTGDIIVAVNNEPVQQFEDLIGYIEKAGANKQIQMMLQPPNRPNESYTVTLTVGPDGKIGVEGATATPPFWLDAETGNVSGGSAGLMLTLAFLDALSPGDLTGNHVLAGTGAILNDGSVGTIRGAAHKVVGAQQAGADIFFVPTKNYNEALTHKNNTLQLVPVDTYLDALEWLCNNGATDELCETL